MKETQAVCPFCGDPLDVLSPFARTCFKRACREQGSPTDDEREALVAFAEKYGASWKEKLLTAWMNGTDWREPNGHLLRRLRNNLGPSWLKNVSL